MKRTLVAALLLGSCNPSPSPPKVTVKGRTFVVELVATRQARRKFLAGKSSLTGDQAILVLYPTDRIRHYEPGSPYGAFEVAFLDADAKVVEVQTIDPNREAGITSEGEVRSALFVPVATGLAKGDAVVFDETVRKSVPEELVALKVNEHAVYAELALTPAEREHGLMFRPRMSKDDGMLFVFCSAEPHEFWMKNTWIPLDIAYFGPDGSFVNVVSMEKYPNPADPQRGDPRAPSAGPAQYVLEVNRGWFAEKGLTDAAGRPLRPIKLVIPPDYQK